MADMAPGKERSPEDLARIQLAAKEAKRTIIVVATICLGSMLVMFLITMVFVALRFL